MGSWSLGRKLYLGVGALVTLTVMSGTVALWSASSLEQELDAATRVTAKALEMSLRLQEDATALRGDQRRIMLAAFAGDTDRVAMSRKDVAAGLALIASHVDQMQSLVGTDEGRSMCAAITAKAGEWKVGNDEVEQAVLRGDVQEAWRIARERTNAQLTAIDEAADGLVGQQNEALALAITNGDSFYRTIWLAIVSVLVVSIALGVAVIWFIVGTVRMLRATTAELSQGAEQVTSAAGQVSTGAQSLSQGTTEQAASLEETSASMEEMASMTRQNAQNATRAAELVSGSSQEFSACDGALREMVTSMAQISDSSQKISRIIKTIDEIAFQTNILALNAAVEAARAGEAGMGFAVVADEVRNLAQRSAQAAKDTAGLIEEAVTSAAEGDGRLKSLAGSIDRIGAQQTEIKALVDEISSASAQQTQGIDQVTQAVQQMEKVTQTTAATAEESAAASEELSAQAQMTLSAVAALARLVDGGGAAAAAAAAPAPRRVARGGNVVQMPRHPQANPEAVIPLEGDGTFGPY